METLEKSRMCRLCGKQSGILIDIFDKNENHVRKINAILPVLVHEIDLLPKQMCHRCSYKLEEFYNFYVECAKTDDELKKQLSWMRKEDLEEKIITPMVKMSKFKIKTEPPDAESNDSDVFGQLNKDSLLFPTSISNHGHFPSSSPIIICSRCRCLCNTNIKISKNSPKESPLNDKSQVCSSNSSVTINNTNILNEFTSVRVNFTKKYSDDNIQEISDVNIKNNQSFQSDDNDEKFNRALRPRKNSVDYLGPKKKKVVTGLKTKVTNKLCITDSISVNNEIKSCSSNSFMTSNHTPVIKLEKVDETAKMLRINKNLEEFNKRIKKIQAENKSREKNRPNYIFRREENLQKETFRKNNLLKTESPLTSSLSTENNFFKKSLLKDEYEKKEKEQKGQFIKNNPFEIISGTEESSIKNSFPIELNLKNNQYSSSNVQYDSNKDVKEICESLENIIVKEQVSEIEMLNVEKDPKTIDKIPFCAVVKLEKDYTCNVDYPKIKIKRHLAVSSASKMEENDSLQDNNTFKLTKEKKLPKNSTSAHSFPKRLKNKNKMLRKLKETHESKVVLKKKNKHLDLSKIKRKVLENGISVVASRTDLKQYCDECDTCFRNKELFKLHPCYQK